MSHKNNNSHNNNRTNDSTDRALDAALREALAGSTSEIGEIDPETILHYLNGTATEEQTAHIRGLLARSSSFRRELLEISEDLERLTTNEAQTAFEAQPAIEAPWYYSFVGKTGPQAAPSQRGFNFERDRKAADAKPSLWDTIQSFFQFQKPAYAYAAAYVATVALMAYPTYRYFTMPSGETGPAGQQPSASMVLPTRSLSVHPEMQLRGSTTTPPLEISLAESGPVLDLTLWTPNERMENQRFQVTVSDGSGVLWQEDDYRGFSAEDTDRFRILMNTQELRAGEITIQITRTSKSSGMEILTETYRLVLE
jgi:hypothetical protein